MEARAMDDPRLPTLLTIRSGSQVHDGRWALVEEELGLTLPGSYKAMVDRFGAASWRDFLHVLSPFDETLELRRRGAGALDADQDLRRQFPSHYPLPLYPEVGGLLPWAISDNGDVLYFITAGSPDSWPTVIKGPRAPEFEVSFLSPTLLVHHFAANTLQSMILPTIE
jgi:hypothetical protein